MLEEKNKVNLKITLKVEYLLDKKGKFVKDANGDKVFKQNDVLALIQLLSVFDSRKYSLKDYKQYLKVQDKVEEAWRKDAKTLELSLDEATFLKDYLVNFNEKSREDGRLPVGSFLLRTLVSVIEQLEG
uniref:Uncharacterized protein n=1 Tax=Dictyoglomus turgidum TaxID=513050 RepID=A0A7C3SPG8_9BACT